MKIDRLLEMTILLLNRGRITARELAERFSVTTRTIYRDIDILSRAGVPVYACRGSGGGISLLESYSLQKAILTSDERDSILFALKTLQATKYPEIEKVVEKLSAVFQSTYYDWVHIDFSPWGSNPNQYERLMDIKNAIIQSKMIEFDYINIGNKKSRRRLVPLKLFFKSHAWYLWGYCMLRKEFRMFRISRIKTLAILDIDFDKVKILAMEPIAPVDHEPVEKKLLELELRFTEEALYRIYDDYDDDMITINNDGTYTVKIVYADEEWIYGYIMSFGEYVEVIAPDCVRKIICERNRRVIDIYKNKGDELYD